MGTLRSAGLTGACVAALIAAAVGARGQWTHGPYTDSLIRYSGNYLVSMADDCATVTAFGIPGSGSYVEVDFAVAYSAPPGTPDIVLTPTARLWGGASGSGSSARSEAQVTSPAPGAFWTYGWGTGSENPYDVVYSNGTTRVAAPGASRSMRAIAEAVIAPGGTAQAATRIWFQ